MIAETRSLRVAARTADALGESPVWIEAEQSLYWVDLRAPALRRLSAEDGRVVSWPTPGPACSAIARRAGGLIVAIGRDLHRFAVDDGVFHRVAGFAEDADDIRLNDAKADPAGRLVIGSMADYGPRPAGRLYALAPDGALARLRDALTVPNAIAFSPNGETMYFADTRAGPIERASYDAIAGRPGAWRLFAAADAAPGRPDGATVDSEGFLWNARYGGSALARFAPDGRLDRLAPLPVSQPTSCAFGGPGLRTLYVTTARQKLSADQLAAEPLAGALLALDVGVAGLPERALGF